MGCCISSSLCCADHSHISTTTNPKSYESYDYLIKVGLVGLPESGKSHMIDILAEKTVSDKYVPTLGVNFRKISYTVNDKVFQLHVWDTSGDTQNSSIVKSYLLTCQIVIIVDTESQRLTDSSVEMIKTMAINPIIIVRIVNKKSATFTLLSDDSPNFFNYKRDNDIKQYMLDCNDKNSLDTLITTTLKNNYWIITKMLCGFAFPK